MSDSSRRFGGKSLFTLALVASAFAFNATAAGAATFCISVPTGECPSGGVEYTGGAGITQALTDAGNNGSSQDTILVQSGSYSAVGGWSVGTNVKLTGVGPTKPILAATEPAPPLAAVVTVSNAFAQVSNIAITTAASVSSTGLQSTVGGVLLSDISVTSPGNLGGTGISVTGQATTIMRPTINLPLGAIHSVGIQAQSATSLLISDALINAPGAIAMTTGTLDAIVRRSRIQACVGVQFQESSGTISSSLIETPVSAASCPSGTTGVRQSIEDGNDYTATPVNSYNNTIVGHGYATDGAFQAETDADDSTASVNVDSTVISGYDQAFVESPVGLGSAANIGVTYSRFQGTAGSAALQTGASALVGDAGFVDAAGGNYALQKSSQLIDAGSPAGLTQKESTTDLAGNPRVASRGAGNIRDIGAFELPNSPPAASIAIATLNPVTTAPITFSGSGSSDPDGDALTYAWKFDTALFSSGENVARTLGTAGPHTVQLTATDSTGASSVTSMQFVVETGVFTLTLNKKAVRAAGRGDFSVKLACPEQATSNCNGKLLFQTTAKKPLKAASYVYSVEPGTTRKLPITTTKSFRKQLMKKKRVRLRMSLSGSTGNASLVATPTTFTLSAPKKKKKK